MSAREELRGMALTLATGVGRLVEPRQFDAAIDAHRAEVLREAALIVVASCPDHQPADAQGSWMDCHCPVADEFRRMANKATTGGAK